MTFDRAIQTRCFRCLGEQYVLNVLYFSDGESGCTVCGQSSFPMPDQQWRDLLTIARQRDADRSKK